MKFRNTAAAFLVMCLLVGALILVKKKEEDKSKAQEAKTRISTVDRESVNRIRLKNPKGDYLFKKESDEWRIVEPVNTEPDPSFIPDILNKLENLESKRDFDIKKDDLSDYGFDEPEFELEIAGGGRTENLSFGMKTPGDNTQYARSGDSLQVRITDTSLSDLNAKTLFDIRNKDIIKFAKDQVSQIRASYPATKEEYAVEKKEKDWRIAEPVSAFADQSEAERLLNALLGVKADEYPAEDYLKSPDKWGFTKPFASITVVMKDGSSKQLLVGKESKEPKGIYVTNPELKLVALTGEDLKKNITVTLNSLIDKKLASWPEDSEITKLEFSSKGLSTLLEKKGDLWMIPALRDFADQNLASGLLSRTKYLRAQEFLTAKPLPEHGFDSPSLTIKAFLKDGKEPLKISFGKTLEGGKVLVRGGADGFIFKADDSFLNNAKSDLQKIRNKKPSLAKRYKINRIKISLASGSANFSKSGPDWTVLVEGNLKYKPQKEKLASDSAKLIDFLTQDKIIAFVDSYDPKLSADTFGFDKPLANISVWDDTSSEEKITIGKKESEFAYMMRAGLEPVYKIGINDIEELLAIFKEGKKEEKP